MINDPTRQAPNLHDVAVEALRQSHILAASVSLPSDELVRVVEEAVCDLRALHDRIAEIEYDEMEVALGHAAPEPDHSHLPWLTRHRPGHMPALHAHNHTADAAPPEPMAPPARREDVERAVIADLQDEARVLADHVLDGIRRAGFVIVKPPA